MKSRFAEILLVAIILVSAGYIGWKLLSKSKIDVSERQAQAPIEGLNKPNPNLDSPEANTVVDGGDFKGRPLGSAEMDALKASRFESANESPACSSQAPQRAFAFQQPALIDAIKEGRLNFYMGDRDARCYKTGTRMQVVLFDIKNPAEKFASVIGSVEIKQIFWGPSEKIPDAVFAAIDVTREAYRFLFPGSSQETLIFFGDFRPENESGRVSIPLFPRTQKISLQSIAAIKAKYPRLVVIDVRSAEEARSNPVPGSVAVDVKLNASLQGKTFFSVTRNELAQATFDASAFLRAVEPSEDKAIVVVGHSEQDMRVAPIILKSVGMRFANAFWLPLGFTE